MNKKIYTTPWTRAALTPEVREQIETLLGDYQCWIGADSPRGPFTVFIVADRSRIDSSRARALTPLRAVEMALDKMREMVVVDGLGYVREWSP